MDMTIGSLKVGAPLIFGRYGVHNDNPYDILWLKATPNSDFITKDVIDMLSFDANEPDSPDYRYSGNENYRLSNLLSFMNSDQEQWFCPTHQYDGPPSRSRCAAPYDGHYGFLYHFEEYELASLVQCTQTINEELVASYIRLPSFSELCDIGKFPLFKKKGVRPHPTEDVVLHRPGYGFDYGSYVPFYLSDKHRTGSAGYVTIFSRSGSADGDFARNRSGLRPVCTINPSTPVVLGDDDMYRVKPHVIKQNVYTDAELFSFLGIAQP